MLIRVVRLTLSPENVPTFLSNFEKNKHNIRGFEGCERLELLRDFSDENVFITYSYWQSEAHLEAYRRSDLFKGIWAVTKPMFSAKPVAWSMRREVVLD